MDTIIKNNLQIHGNSASINAKSIITDSDSQTLTNKTIDSDNNTITNIVNGNIKSSAGIDVTKLSTGTVDNTHFDYIASLTGNVQDQLDNKIETSEKGSNNGVATLDAGGKVPVSQLPNSVMELQGPYNATTNTPTLVDGTGNPGDIYEVTVDGTQDFGNGNIIFNVGDWVVYGADGKWYKSINSNEVVTVNGQKGVVVLSNSDIGLGNVTNDLQLKAADLDIDGTLTANSDTKIASQKAVKTYADTKQPGDATLTALAGFNSNGIMVQTAADTFTSRTIDVGSGLVIADGNGVAANPTINFDTNALDTIAPTANKGDIIVHDGTNNIAISVGADGTALIADSGFPSGYAFYPVPIASFGDINETTSNLNNNVSTPTDVINFTFDNGSVRSFEAQAIVVINATTNLYETFNITGIQKDSDWFLNYTSNGDNSGIVFTITSTGQIQYVSSNYPGYSAGSINFRVNVLG